MTTIHFGDFEWDEAKAAANAKKHDVSFEEASTVFSDPLALVQPDAEDGARFVILGRSATARTLFVVYAERDDHAVRLISARKATSHERKAYENKS